MQCREAPSLGTFEDSPHNVWGTVPYENPNDGGTDFLCSIGWHNKGTSNEHYSSWGGCKHYKPTVFFGLYDLRDYWALFRHKGKKYVLWCGSDLRNLTKSFIFNDGKLRWLSKLCPGFKFILKWILKDAEHWVENTTEWHALQKYGFGSQICPSWLGEVDLPISYKWSKKPHIYVSTGSKRQEEYGFSVIERIAPLLPDHTFHLYGDTWETKQPNIRCHGRVPKEQMNEEIKNMQCGLRLNEFDGFSEVLAKAVLQGQYAISRIPYPLIPHYNNEEELVQYLQSLKKCYRPNKKAREYYQLKLNRFPWSKTHSPKDI